MKEKIMSILMKPLEIVELFLEGVAVQMKDTKKVFLYAIGLIILWDVLTGGSLAAVDFAMTEIKELVSILSAEFDKNGKLIGVLAALYVIYKSKSDK